jgi:putative RNA 2'-phosphotransferase
MTYSSSNRTKSTRGGTDKLVRASKFLSLVLRHQPEKIGMELDPQGWVPVDELLAACKRAGVALDANLLRQVVADNDKQRFAYSEDGKRIRASQGHSVDVDLGLERIAPPTLLFHGTADRFMESIRREGLLHGNRTHVHLSVDEITATKVGQRHGRPVVLTVLAGAMAQDDFAFYRSDNGVWLTETVPPAYLQFPEYASRSGS